MNQENKDITFYMTIEGNHLNSGTKAKLTKGKETEKAICFHETKNICTYHPPGMIGSPFARYADKRYYYWIPKSVLLKSKKVGVSNIENKTTSWVIVLPEWFKEFKVHREHFMKKVKKSKSKKVA
ncbi:MAG: hypothetical protein SLAVMIC_00028 [uncultured marine phage]|uniref:Uncharacterized protein n=1 Tax=uncultured marine phage TaxID=707152 RepID=A0A8D9CBJ7_9VIRU|nr:MAG: hypothetical protein SLAVMIC_00028 [uncultured marine phage]